jgi:hypothetical protein
MRKVEQQEFGSFVVAQMQEANNPNRKIVIQPTVPLEGRDEMNLVELPFALVSYRNTQNIKTIESRWQSRDEDGKVKEVYKIVTGSDKWGLPTFQAEEVLIAALELTHRQGFRERKVHTTKYEFMSLMKWPDTGHYRRLLTHTLYQIEGVLIATNHFWDREKKKYKEVGFHIIDEHTFYDEEQKRRKGDKGQLSLAFGYFIWGETLWHSMRAGYIKRLDTAAYFSLRSNLSRRLYRFADKHVHDGGLEIDLFHLALNKLVMAGNYKYPSQVIRELQRAIDELKTRKLAAIRIVKSKTESGYKVVIGGIGGRQQVQKPLNGIRRQAGDPSKGQTGAGNAEASNGAQDLIDRLKAYGVAANQVTGPEELLRDYGVEEVAKRIALCDYLVKKGKAPLSPQLIVDSLRKGYLPDPYHEIEAEQDRQADREAREQALLAEWQRRKAEAQAQVKEWASLPPEKRIDFGRLDFWETSFRLRRRRNPTKEEKAAQIAKMIADLPGREEKLEQLLRDIRSELEAKAREQGIRFPA